MLFSTLELLLAMSSVVLAAPDFGALDGSRKHWPGNSKPQNLDEYAFKAEFDVLAIRKMSHKDEGEKFYHEDWNLRKRETVVEVRTLVKRTAEFKAPSRRLAEAELATPAGILRLFKRQAQFTCPQGTSACSNIQRPGSCCEITEDCYKIQNTGLGDVGCCPKGSSCTGELNDCGNKKTCARNEGGGCCIDGYKCSVNGCIPDGTAPRLTTAQPTFTEPTGGAAAGAGDKAGDSASCPSSAYACPASLGGGCCQKGRACAIASCPASSEAQETATDGGVPTPCPTGFYGCPAQFNGGCCRVGRDCGINTCPPRGGSNEDGGDGVSPTGNGFSCPNGWYNCAASFGGGCCPDGYNCALESCPARDVNAAAATKVAGVPGAASSVRSGAYCLALLLFIGSAVVLL